MKQKFRSDFGTYYSHKYDRKTSHLFYSVPCHQIDHIGHNLYSMMDTITVEGNEFAISFDFSKEKLIELLRQLPTSVFKEYLIDTLVNEFTTPQKAQFHETPILIDVKAKLGEPVQSLYETFFPFIIEEVTLCH